MRALEIIAVEVLKEARLPVVLDPLGDNLQLEAVTEIDDRAHDLHRARVAPEILEEGLVDLDAVEIEILQVAEARIAGPEIVQHDLDAELAQLPDRALRRVHVRNEHALGDLEPHLGRAQPGGQDRKSTSL